MIANKTDCIRTVKYNHKRLCPEVKDKKLKKGKVIS